MFKREFSFKKSVKFFLGIFLLTTISVLFYYITPILFAWTGPSEGPPGGNLDLVGIVRNRFSMVEANVSGNVEIDLSQGSVFKHTLTGNVTYTGITGYSAGKLNSFKLIIEQDATNVYEITWPGSVVWRGYIAPTNPGANTRAIYDFSTVDDGSTWYAFDFYAPSSRIFGSSPVSLDGVSFFDGTPEKGMIVFKTVGTYSIEPAEVANVEVLVVAGGGAGGNLFGGGGGAGGLLYNDSFSIQKSAMVVTVGSGGSAGNNGSNSVFGSMAAIGGGRGGSGDPQNGFNGGSGGGGSSRSTSGTVSGGIGTVGPPRQGYDGGMGGWTNAGHYGPAGGGGAGGVGNNYAYTQAGHGGVGVLYYGSYYGGGGGGGGYNFAVACIRGIGGSSIGGSGGQATNSTGTVGINNTGSGGGGGAGGGAGIGGGGGSGIVIVRWGGYNKSYNPTTNAVW